jgi:(2Fe-2S) ferredoxin/DNA-directed RNA polymerase subunit RPC12/RpoP
MSLDLIAEHKIAMSIFELGKKSAADLHFSGKLQIDSLGDLVVDVPSALLRGCFSAIKEPGAELCVGSAWKARFIVMDRDEVETIGSKAISERGKDFDFKINGSSSSSIDTPDISKIWYLDIDCPDAERIRQSYGLKGKPEAGFRALFGVRRKRLFTNSSVAKDVKWAKPEEKPGASSGEWKWTKLAELLPSVQLQHHQQALADEIDPDHPVKKLLMWQVGSGKSLGAIAGSEAYGKPYTVVGPAAMRPTFKNEQSRFTDRALPSEVISYHKAVRSGVPHPESLVFDEAQRIINPSSGQSQAAVEAARHAKQVLMLSGTPVVNRPGDLAPMVNVLTGKNFSPKSFEERYLDREAQPRSWGQWASGQPIKQNPVVRNREELKAMLAGKVDWYAPDKPMVDTRYSDHEVEMSPEQTKLYNAMFGKIPLRLRLGMDDLTAMTPKELLRLQSFLAGPRQVGLSDYPFAKHRDPMQSFNTSAKLQMAFGKLKEKLDGDPRTKGIVYSNFPRAGLEPYRAALQRHNIPHTIFDGSLSDNERNEAVRSFNEGRSRVALVGPAGAEGISLRGAQLLQQLDPHWQDAKMRQSAARGIRFDSHTHLPEELRNIEVQRFISKLPPKAKSILQSLHLVPYQEKLRPGSDDYLRNLAEDKEKSNRLFMELLKEVGQRKQAIFSLPAREVIKTANLQTGVNALSLPAVKIDRPRGFQKIFQTPKGPLATTYPVDYGYFDGYINPEDKDGADVFMGTGGATGLHGRFMKGKNLTGKWEPDERKWYANLTPAEHKAVLHFYHQQDPTLLADHVSFKTHKDLIGDLNSLRAAVPSDPKGMTLENVHKLAQMVSVPISESCQECKAQVTTTTTDLDGSKHVNCSNCGKRTFVLMMDKDRDNLLDAASKETHCEPSKEQMEAGNYNKGKFGWHDLVIALESPKGSVRRGVTKAGKAWETKMQDHYGYILKHVSEADGDHVDVFVASDPDYSNTTVYVIDQFIDGKFDEHKCVLLARDAKHAKEIYERNYQKGWDGFKNLSTMSLSEFKDFLVNGTKEPAFKAVPQADIQTVKSTLKDLKEEVKKIDKTGDDSGGGYGDVYLCKRTNKAWMISGDWWSEEVCQLYLKRLRKALPEYEWRGEAESTPNGYCHAHMGDWVHIKSGDTR